jgi:hypothetical protein
MASRNKVFVSPGVYTSETDLTFITRNLGLTSLGVVGETLKGPAFQPILTTNYSEFRRFFGGLSDEKFKANGYAKFELPYIAKEYLKQADQLYITRVLGLSGYNAGKSWGVMGSNGQVLALLRSRASYDGELLTFKADDDDSVVITGDTTAITTDAYGDFTIKINSDESYIVSLDPSKRNYIVRVLGTDPNKGKPSIYVDEIYPKLTASLIEDNSIGGLYLDATSGNAVLENFSDRYSDFREEYKSAQSPYVISEVNGNTIKKLFRFITISDGNGANTEIKVSITNIQPNNKTFDVVIRAFNDSDANPVVLERFSNCTMDSTSDKFVGRRIGTLDGYYISKSSYVLVDLSEEDDTKDSFPCGFEGIQTRRYADPNDTTQILRVSPNLTLKNTYTAFEKKKKTYLGFSSDLDIDNDILKYKGDLDPSDLMYTDGFHMDVEAQNAVLTTGHTFVYGDSKIQTDADLEENGNSYAKLESRKFTLPFYGGFDGWDVHRDERSHEDEFVLGSSLIDLNDNTHSTKQRDMLDGENGLTTDYYAFLEGIKTFNNPLEIDINIFATAGIDIINNSNLVERGVDMIEEERCDSLYVIATPDTMNGSQDMLTPSDVTSQVNDTGIDTSYGTTLFPHVQYNDTENDSLIYISATADMCRNLAYTDKIAAPWFAAAGLERGTVLAEQARKKLTLPQSDILYSNRINPIMTFPSDGIKIFGNRTLQVRESALDRVNVRRLLLRARKLISAISLQLVFDQNDATVDREFKNLVNPILETIKRERGLTEFRVETDRSPESIDRKELIGKIRIKPTPSLEYIDINFEVSNTGASFDDI